ncbi:MAG: substrate-binding domain-containing protein, partial [Planctomycetota bacterium]
HGGGRDRRAVVEHVLGGNAWGVMLDSIDPSLQEAVLKAGLPVVMVNSWVEDAPVDVALQDNFRGGFLAADYLVKLGAKRIGWVGATSEFCHSRERFGGAGAGLSVHGLRFDAADVVNVTGKQAGAERAEALERLLARSDRPEAVLAFGMAGMAAVRRAAEKTGLVLGRDIEVVGWVVEECYELHYRPIFEGGYIPPAIVWSAREMAERAVSLLAERGEGAGRRAVRACIATELKTWGEGR